MPQRNSPYYSMSHPATPFQKPSALQSLDTYFQGVKERNRQAAIEASRRGADPLAPLTTLTQATNYFMEPIKEEFGIQDMAEGLRERDPLKFAEGVGWSGVGLAGVLGAPIKAGKMMLEPVLLKESILDDGLKEAWKLIKKVLPAGTAAATLTPKETEAGKMKNIWEVLEQMGEAPRRTEMPRDLLPATRRARKYINELGLNNVERETLLDVLLEGDFRAEDVEEAARYLRMQKNEQSR